MTLTASAGSLTAFGFEAAIRGSTLCESYGHYRQSKRHEGVRVLVLDRGAKKR
ncbi:hypothetical protein AA0114_g3369 [Alternaria tenuissima]|uniref:Uncharacterized protein n=1 Tax=Alternaria tenuissima TaxID=119927 RepID=A0A4Q4MP74_9PLEO|nr:hypothetical protein AA0114_g3369 [Alternaria tenuissima]